MDLTLFRLINGRWTNAPLDRLMAAMSSFDLWLWPLVLLVLITLCLGGFRARAMICCGVLILGLGDGAVANHVKKLVHRPRPHQVLADVRMVDLPRARPRLLALFQPAKVAASRPDSSRGVEGRSFPSAHILNNFCAATLLAAFYRRRGWLYFLPASLVAYSRIYVGSHWPSDALGSTALAFLLTLPLLAGLAWLWRRHGARLLPNVHARHPRLLNL